MEKIWGLISLNIKKMQILSILFHNNRDKDVDNNGQITKVGTQVITIILLIPNNHAWEIWS